MDANSPKVRRALEPTPTSPHRDTVTTDRTIARVRCGDAELAVEESGQGEALLFVHAFPLNRRMWAPQLSALSGDARCIAPDLRGFGESDAGSGEWTMDRFADDLACVLDHLEVRRAAVCGLSLGGYVALAFWRRHSDRVRALVLADTRAGADDEKGRQKRRDTIAAARDKGAHVVAVDSMSGLLGKATRESAGAPVSLTRSILEEARLEGVVGASEAMMNRPDSTPDLAGISVPTLIVVGDEDALTPVKESRILADNIPGSRLEIIQGAGHLSNVERPAAFSLLLREFVSSLPATGG